MNSHELSNDVTDLDKPDKDKQPMANNVSDQCDPVNDRNLSDKGTAIEEIAEEDKPVNLTRKHKNDGGNLVNFKDNTKEKQREIALAGAKASAEAKRRRKTLRESLEALLSAGTTQDDICTALLNKAKNGSYRACRI